ncbi:MAG TPA: SGNH/GDSL hydrolase family protein [Planctomycetota bacterium]|nr:SGNH/GDSL hydrolase family protein [Planctomycetota bacterium]
MVPSPPRTSGYWRFLQRIGTRLFVAGALAVIASPSGAQEPPKPRPSFSDATKTVVLLGNGLIEESQASGYIEARLNRRFPGRRIDFRNLGWTGDTVWARARTNGYQNPSGLDRLKKQTAELKPDLILVGYGLSESFEGASGLEKFKEGYGKLLDLLGGITPHLVLLSPAPHEDLGRPYPDPTEHNKSLELFGEAIRAIADHRQLPFVDLFHPLERAKRAAPGAHISTNGILLSDTGYWLVSLEIERQLGLSRPAWRLDLRASGEVKSSAGAKASDVVSSADGLDWKVVEDQLPSPPAPAAAQGMAASMEPGPVLAISGLREGNWTLRINGQEIVSAPARSWESGVSVTRGASFDQVEALRRAIAKRNGLYTRRWRPINDWPAHYTYIAPDYALYDGLVAEQDELIAAQSKPAALAFSLSLKKP